MANTSEKVAALSEFIDDSYWRAGIEIGSELHIRRRTDKLMEEVGEVGEALGGWYGENPRKGFTHTRADYLKELLDVMTTAAGAYESATGNEGIVLEHFDAHMSELLERVGINIEEEV